MILPLVPKRGEGQGGNGSCCYICSRWGEYTVGKAPPQICRGELSWAKRLIQGGTMFSRISTLIAAFFSILLLSVAAHAQMERPAMLVPPPTVDEPKTKSGTETAILAGGCF